MTDYVAIPNGQINQDKPVTRSLVQQLRDNPLAIIEGAAGAPRISQRAFGGFTAGDILLHTNLTGVQMTNAGPGFQKWKSTKVMYEGTYRVKFNYGVTTGYGANVQLYVDNIPQGSPVAISGGGEITADVTIASGSEIGIWGNGGSAPGLSGAVVSNLRIYASEPVGYGTVS